MKVLILRGCQGSGKSTLAEELADEDEWINGSVIVSADYAFVTADGYKFDPRRLGEAHAKCFRSFLKVLEADAVSLLVVDNTNASREEISPYILGAEAYDKRVAIYTVKHDPMESALRNVHGVPVESVLAKAKQIEEEKLPPWWRQLQNKQEILNWFNGYG